MTFSFSHHVELLDQFLSRRQAIVEGIEHRLLNVRGKDASRRRDRPYFERALDACFFEAPGVSREASRLKGQLAARHLADGFEPLLLERYPNELDPLELIVRALQHWERHRWPGQAGRLTYAQRIYAVFMVRQLEHLSLRVWDEGNDRAGDRLHDVQHLLDRLNAPDIPNVLVRDAGWLIQTAQGPVTRHLRPYLELADKIADSFSAADRLAIHKAGARLGGGHLRSQLCYQAWKTDRPLDDPHNFAFTRNSNSMDNALLVRDLVPLLDAYQQVCGEPDAEGRLDLADAILQGLSADPELLVTRLDLLTPCTMIEDLFIDRGENGRARYTSMGEAHVQLLGRYGELIGRLATSLKADAVTFDPAQRAYSPHGLAYGFCADILSNLAVRALYSQPSFGLSLEDVFVSRGHLDDKLAQARGWAALPRGEGERAHFDHSMERAEQSFARLMQALDDRASHPTRANASKFPDGKLYVVPEGVSEESVPGGFVPDGIVRAEEHCFTSDMKRGLESAATAVPKSHMLNDRKEGRFLTSAESGGTWFGISKVLLTLITSQGQDALLTGVPPAAVEVLPLTCPGLVVLLPA